jgi:predicted cobalt transporter CbtA
MVRSVTSIIAAVVVVGGLVASVAKAYYETPMVLRDHDKKIEKLEATDSAHAKDMNEMRQLLWEIRGDVKYLRSDKTN